MSQDLLRITRPQASLQIHARELTDGNERVLDLVGSIDADGAPELSRYLEGLLTKGETHVALDLSEVKFVSSSGIGALVAAIAERRDEGGDLVLLGVSDSIREVMEALDLMDYVTLR